jgi:hypothetical protein
MIRLSHHAHLRLRERVGLPGCDVRNAIRLPKSAWRRIDHVTSDRGARLYATGAAVLIVRGRVAVTAVRMSLESLADVLVWVLFGMWP